MGERLRIAQVAPVASRVVKESGGSIEQLVWLLTEELVRRGHEVTLFATGDSRTSAALDAAYPAGYDDCNTGVSDWRFRETMHAASAFAQANRFDIIHTHVYHYALPFTRFVATPVVQTYHVMPEDDIIAEYARHPEVHVAAISQYQKDALSGITNSSVVHHGIDTDTFPFRAERGEYLLFLGRIIPRKGPEHAIRLARTAGMRLVIAGGGEEDYLRASIAPFVDGRTVEYVGHVGARERNRLLRSAAALLFPTVVPEPFGLVMIEAMACGVPVVALDCGPVPEIVDHGVTGFYADDLARLQAYIPAALLLDRARIRGHTIARFDYRRMVSDYEAVYRRVIAGRRSTSS